MANQQKPSMCSNFADLFNDSFKGVRMEDRGCFGGEPGEYLVYVTTKDYEPPHRRQPWTAVYKTYLKTGKTDRLTPSCKNWGVYLADISNGNIFQVTPEDIDAGTPVAIDIHPVAVATIRLFRVSGGFPTFSSDGSKLAFVDNNFKAVWVVDDQCRS
ncbi:Lactonase drp35 [Bienertia sinuspersici]